MSLSIVLLAAGKARRMGGTKPKALCELGGEPLIFHVLRELQKLPSAQLHIVVGFGGEQVRETVFNRFSELNSVHWHQQDEQLGTAHAVSQALPAIAPDDQVLVSYTDMPFIDASSYQMLLALQVQYEMAFMTTQLKDPMGYGRVLRGDDGRIMRIVEEVDASPDERKVEEVNIGIMTAQAQTLSKLIKKVANDNKQQEYYLTDCIQIAVAEDIDVGVCGLKETWQVHGINTPRQYTVAERLLQQMRVSGLIENGAIVQDADRLDVRSETVQLGRGVSFDVGVILEGEIDLGDDVRIEAYSVLKNVSIAAGTIVRSFSHIEGARIGKCCIVGPYARIRPDTRIGDNNRIGNFVEIKQTTTGDDSKINHLSYVGDSKIGSEVNVGAGTITCNYDGVNKHHTVIGDNVFIGSDTQIIAPIEIGSNATIGAGSTITHDVPADELTLSRCKQTTVKGWRRPTKK